MLSVHMKVELIKLKEDLITIIIKTMKRAIIKDFLI